MNPPHFGGCCSTYIVLRQGDLFSYVTKRPHWPDSALDPERNDDHSNLYGVKCLEGQDRRST